jgi:hypothetical protein
MEIEDESTHWSSIHNWDTYTILVILLLFIGIIIHIILFSRNIVLQTPDDPVDYSKDPLKGAQIWS